MKIISLKYILLFVFAVSFIGCSQKSATEFSNKSPSYAQLAKYTKIAKIVIDNEVQAMANITYLSEAQKESWDKGYEYFLVGVYTEKFKKEELIFNLVTPDTRVKPYAIQEMSTQEELYQNIPFKNNWAEYKIIKFKALKDEEIKLQFFLDANNFQEVTFNKTFF